QSANVWIRVGDLAATIHHQLHSFRGVIGTEVQQRKIAMRGLKHWLEYAEVRLHHGYWANDTRSAAAATRARRSQPRRPAAGRSGLGDESCIISKSVCINSLR